MFAKKLSAFTIVELMVVMAILAVLSAIGLSGMNTFRDYVQVQQANSNFVIQLKTVQNMARNGELSTVNLKPNCTDTFNANLCKLPDGYALYFDSALNYSLRSCFTQTLAGNQVYTCPVERQTMKSNEFRDVTIENGAPNCKGILFLRLSGDIMGIDKDNNAISVNSGTCQVTISYRSIGRQRAVNIDFSADRIYE